VITSSGSPLVEINRGGAETPLFCIHAAAGHLRLYDNLARHLDPERPVYGLRAVPDTRLSRFHDIAQSYVGDILERQPAGPHIVVGECEGGALAYEVAQQLRAACRNSPFLVLVDSFGPGSPQLRPLVPGPLYRAVDAARLLGFHVLALACLDSHQRWAYLAPRVGRVAHRINSRILRRAGREPAEAKATKAFREALRDYVAVPYDGRGLLLRGAKLPWGIEPESDLGWNRLVGRLAVRTLPAYFGTNLLEPNVGTLAECLERELEAFAPTSLSPRPVDATSRISSP
jgi:thioesterase domain-containing protein